jgi:hypothetical protein
VEDEDDQAAVDIDRRNNRGKEPLGSSLMEALGIWKHWEFSQVPCEALIKRSSWLLLPSSPPYDGKERFVGAPSKRGVGGRSAASHICARASGGQRLG